MLSLEAIKNVAVKWHTSPQNVAREYVQHLFLSSLYQSKESETLAFKGGTALRLIYQSPRFSEDLDFSAHIKPFHLERLLSQTLAKLKATAIPFETKESKPTSGGYFALYSCEMLGEHFGIELNISLRRRVHPDPVLITSPLLPPYQCLSLPVKELVQEKLEALLFRKKPRDFYDLYFLLRQRLGVESIVSYKSKLLLAVRSASAKTLQQELKLFLPASHQRLISELPQALTRELERL